MKIKICGLKTIEDSMAVCRAGADMLGFNFYRLSPRYIELTVCREIINRIKQEFPNAIHVGVFVNQSVDEIKEIVEITRIDAVQLSGNETIETLQHVGEIAFKALRVSTFDEVEEIIDLLPKRSLSPAFLIDSYDEETYGGTGKTGNWALAAKVAKNHRILLAGGLNPENIEEAIRKVRPWGVDVASGVERECGVKDPEKIIKFIQKARIVAELNRH
jgi:phosphoribosylanthranilate isomerase